MLPRPWRWLIVGMALVMALSIVAVTHLFVQVQDDQDQLDELTAANERSLERGADLICSLGTLLSATPVTRRNGETERAFSNRVKVLRGFASDLRMLDRCDPKKPTIVRVRPKDRKALRQARERRERRERQQRRQGGGAQSSPPPASQPPGPPSSGPSPPKSGGGTNNPPAPPGPGNSSPNLPDHVCGNAPQNPHCRALIEPLQEIVEWLADDPLNEPLPLPDEPLIPDEPSEPEPVPEPEPPAPDPAE